MPMSTTHSISKHSGNSKISTTSSQTILFGMAFSEEANGILELDCSKNGGYPSQQSGLMSE